MTKTIFLFLLLGFFGNANAKPLYAVCKGRYTTFDFVGEGNGMGHVQINSGRISLSTEDSVVLAPTDGLMANTASSFELGSIAYHGTVTIHEDGKLELTDPRGFGDTATCTTNLFAGKIVQASSEGPVTVPACGKILFANELNRLKEEADYNASDQCGEPRDQGRNIARIEKELFEGYDIELTCLGDGKTTAKVTSRYRCL